MKKKILLIGYNYAPEPTGIGKYSGEMIHWLASRGHECTVITTYPYYPYWQIQEPYVKRKFWYQCETQSFPSGGKINVFRCPAYIPCKPTAIRRMLLDCSFLVSAFFKLVGVMSKFQFDQVITVSPSLLLGILGVLVKKIQDNQFTYHIQDLQIEAARDLKLIRFQSLISILLKIERYIFNNADQISTISTAMAHKIRQKSHKDIYLFSNWVNTELFYPLQDKAELKKEFGFSPNDKFVLYSGAIGEKQGLERILLTAKNLEYDKQIQFIICGSGPYVEHLVAQKENMGLTNVIFIPLQPLEKFKKMLNLADLHLVLQKSNATDLMLPSKLTTIWSVGGVSLVTAMKGSELYNTIHKFNTGIIIDPDDSHALQDGIVKAVSGENNNRIISDNARRYAENHLSLESIMTNFEYEVLHFPVRRMRSQNSTVRV
ncbi:WcaI family glycosyltransferase [Cyclobacterium jeungdonense]|uniref:WcaI family glycosyltransferase n=1 Tax=Cyclobacterium jeungdonense TaxID=708087 RepID=A0ABT8C9N7_9BACT|nr:WcaI family glycosyltransferase [Cyclobacterium jeungdonense]MDN3688852.1 WcaI family glycosyltransferase [Cyclobacterium jeungdonense]